MVEEDEVKYSQNTLWGTGEMIQWLRVLAASPEDQLHFQGLQCPLLASTGTACTLCTDMQANTHTHMIKLNILKKYIVCMYGIFKELIKILYF